MSKVSKPEITSQFNVKWRHNDVPVLANEHVRLKAHLTGVSMGTELMWYDASAPALVSGRRSFPYTPGYEFVGIVEEIGSEVNSNRDAYPRLSSLKKGDRIFALKPHSNIADISEKDVWVTIPSNASNEDALSLALTCTCLHAYHRVSPTFGSDAAVVGFGVVGALMLQVLRASNAGRIVALSRSEEKRNQAITYGATEVLDTNDVRSGNLAKDFQFVDNVFECTGKTAGVAIASKLAANQGAIGAVGFYTEPLNIDGEDLFARELTVYGVRASGANGDRSEFVRWPRVENLKLARALLERGQISVSDMITHRLKPEELAEAYDMARTGSEPYGLVVLDWSNV